MSCIHIVARCQCPGTFLCRFFRYIESWFLEEAGIKVRYFVLLRFCKDYRRSDCGGLEVLEDKLCHARTLNDTLRTSVANTPNHGGTCE